jgi:hypothetical protein
LVTLHDPLLHSPKEHRQYHKEQRRERHQSANDNNSQWSLDFETRGARQGNGVRPSAATRAVFTIG